MSGRRITRRGWVWIGGLVYSLAFLAGIAWVLR
jgi:hypothetical protein